MLDSESLEKLQGASIEERIAIIEVILQSLKNDIKDTSQTKPSSDSQRPAFGAMKNSGQILGDLVAPILPASERTHLSTAQRCRLD